MLFQATISKWEGVSEGSRVLNTVSGTPMILNSNRMSGLKIRATTKSCFYYTDILWGKREVATYVECEDSVSDIEALLSLDETLIASFPVWVDNDITKSTPTVYLNLAMVIWGYAYPPSSASNSVLFCQNNGGIKEYVVNLSLTGIISSLNTWVSQYYIIKSGDTWFKREINNTYSYFILWYSSDGGETYEDIVQLDLTEESVLIDLDHEYVHSIVGTAYQVATTGGEILYST